MTGGRIGPGSRSLMLSRPRVRIHFWATCSPASSTRDRSGPRRGIGPVSLIAGKLPVSRRAGKLPVFRDTGRTGRSPKIWAGVGAVGEGPRDPRVGSDRGSGAERFLVK